MRHDRADARERIGHMLERLEAGDEVEFPSGGLANSGTNGSKVVATGKPAARSSAAQHVVAAAKIEHTQCRLVRAE